MSPLRVAEVEVRSALTRTSGFLKTVSSHSLQPYRGCTFGNALCGAGCYVQHNRWLTRGERWGSFLDARVNAADAYRAQYDRELRWARRSRDGLSVFMSSSTDPFLPHEDRFRVTHGVLEAMCERPPDELIVQTHTDRATRELPLFAELGRKCALRFHVSIESDRDRLPGLPPPAASIERRFAAARALHDAGHRVVVTVAPLLPIVAPARFFARIGEVADAVVVDHFIEGDGTPTGTRTVRTALPAAIAAVDPGALELGYRERIVEIARRVMPGRVGVSIDGFAGRML